MAYTPTNEYLKTQVMTASPEMLQLMLWDGAIRFAEQGKDAIQKKDIEGSYKALIRAQKIIMEMSNALRPDVNPELCKNMAALYNFMYRRLVEANLKKDPALVDDALEIMRHQRETWVMLMEKLASERAAEAQETAQVNADAINDAVEVSAAAAGATVTPSVPPGVIGPRRPFGYGNLANKPTPARVALSVEG